PTYPRAPGSPGAMARHRVDALVPGSVIESGAEPVQLSLEGVATWTLTPGSRARVRSISVPHVVELEHGTIVAEVVPRYDTSALIEAFAVEVGGTRVAVRGTVFSVERIGDMVDVEVTRGAVTVGPAGHRGPTTGVLLTSPARGVFDAATAVFV